MKKKNGEKLNQKQTFLHFNKRKDCKRKVNKKVKQYNVKTIKFK